MSYPPLPTHIPSSTNTITHLPLLRLLRTHLPRASLHLYWTLVFHHEYLEPAAALEVVGARVAVGDLEGAVRDLRRWPAKLPSDAPFLEVLRHLALSPEAGTAIRLAREVESILAVNFAPISRRALQYFCLIELPTPLGRRVASRQSLARADGYFSQIKDIHMNRAVGGLQAQENVDLAALLLYSHARTESWVPVSRYWDLILRMSKGDESAVPPLALVGMIMYHSRAETSDEAEGNVDVVSRLPEATRYYELLRKLHPGHPIDPFASIKLAHKLARARSLRPLVPLIVDATSNARAAWSNAGVYRILYRTSEFASPGILFAMLRRFQRNMTLDSELYAPLFGACRRAKNWVVLREAWREVWEDVVVARGQKISPKCAVAVVGALAKGVVEIPTDLWETLDLPEPLPASYNPVPEPGEEWPSGTPPPAKVVMRTLFVLHRAHDMPQEWFTATSIVGMFSRLGKIGEAKRIFRMVQKDTTAPPPRAVLNAVLLGYVRNKDREGAWRWAQESGLVTVKDGVADITAGDLWTMNKFLQMSLKTGESHALKGDLGSEFTRAVDTVTYNTLASNELERIPAPHRSTGNEDFGAKAALQIISAVDGREHFPTHVTHGILVNAFVRQGNIDRASRIVERSAELGFIVASETWTILIGGVVKHATNRKDGKRTIHKGHARRALSPAYDLLEKFEQPFRGSASVHVLTEIVAGHLRLGQIRQAVLLAEQYALEHQVKPDKLLTNLFWLGLVNCKTGVNHLLRKHIRGEGSNPPSHRLSTGLHRLLNVADRITALCPPDHLRRCTPLLDFYCAIAELKSGKSLPHSPEVRAFNILQRNWEGLEHTKPVKGIGVSHRVRARVRAVLDKTNDG
ncbi:hypothetical protein M427DRAFT_246610 [Gonapodya prolifera JEL478]|uniref:Pentacotripeptide-repeat region of PRORP domain-containing protein n=1 Tax=Gonapodya prolifera (strain JEL478) TaxID=1344416 RepID=A0A139AM01_GONPJ|nr:hypothetical protein M427DRAFT_246610 [Gonapodya prolifera JEL478]|eukprot:KXS17800.1 hypothetical protein M427DRAFT_246610 [Gonapodya prolifera JEL478]